MHRNNRYKTAASASRPHLRLRIPRETLEEPLGAPLGNTPGNPLGEPLGGSEETSGGTSEETSGRTPGGPLEEPLGGTRRPTAGHFRTQQSLVRRRRGVEACIALPITLLAQAGSKSSTTGGTQNQRTQGQKNIRLKTVRDVTQVVRGVLEIQGGRRGRPPWGSPWGRGAGVHPGCLPGDRQGSTRLEGSTRDCDANLPLQHLNSHSGP